ncbi:MAG: YlxR family protein [Selenomonas ruminantium]|jgi:predicted RNA-binding protein YlxR (DUF448 family)|nr:YlxR family protein [Selenomonas ruminantium]
MKTKKLPERFCLGCQQSLPKKSLVRIVRSPEGEYAVDATGKLPGRGAYICPKAECFEKAQKSRGLERSFKGKVPQEVYEQLAEQVASLEKSQAEAGA